MTDSCDFSFNEKNKNSGENTIFGDKNTYHDRCNTVTDEIRRERLDTVASRRREPIPVGPTTTLMWSPRHKRNKIMK